MRQVAGGYTQGIIRTETTSADPTPCVRWQADIPKGYLHPTQHLLILTLELGGRQIYLAVIRTSTTSADPDPCIR